MSQAANIFDFVDYSEFLKVRGQQHLSRRNRPFTSEAWAHRLGYRSAQTVSMVLSGHRLPSSDLLERLARDLELSDHEQRYLGLLVQLEKVKRRGDSVRPVVEALERLNPGFAERTPVDAATFAYISEWYHLVIKQLVDTPDFAEDAEWIRERLRRKVTTAEVTRALATLSQLRMLRREPGTGQLRTTGGGLATAQDIPNQAIRLHLRQMLERALEALDEQPVSAREVTALTLRFAAARLPAAKAAIRRFKDEFDRDFEDLGASSVYQLNIQLFPHTTDAPPARKGESP